MKEKFLKAELEIVKFETEDVITASGGPGTGENELLPIDFDSFDPFADQPM